MISIRAEQQADYKEIYQLNQIAFGGDSEANLVNALRSRVTPLISLVALHDDWLVGHILFSPVTLEKNEDLNLMGLAPMAVLPAHQKRGIGGKLVLAGLAACSELNTDAIAVLGYPGYYPKFGFVPSVEYEMSSEYDVPAEVFMIRELKAGALKGRSGQISYHPIFAGL